MEESCRTICTRSVCGKVFLGSVPGACRNIVVPYARGVCGKVFLHGVPGARLNLLYGVPGARGFCQWCFALLVGGGLSVGPRDLLEVKVHGGYAVLCNRKRRSYWGTREGEYVVPRGVLEVRDHAGYVVERNCRRRKATGGVEQGRMWVPGACWRSRTMLDMQRKERGGRLTPSAKWKQSSSRASGAACIVFSLGGGLIVGPWGLLEVKVHAGYAVEGNCKRRSQWGTRAGEDVGPRGLRECKVHAGYAVEGNCRKRSYWGTRAGEHVGPRGLLEVKVHAGYVVERNCKKGKLVGD
ncbi:hypothetical protein ACER0C_030845 [Sarotherodon galilaeus]